MERGGAARLGRETVEIVQRRGYEVGGRRIDLGPAVDFAVSGTREHRPEDDVPLEAPGGHDTRFEVTGETTLEAGRRLAGEGLRPAALNFASAKHPGGGFLGGARAQEESLARSSALFACLDGREMYSFHRARRDPMYTHWVIWSPEVPVFREDDGTLLEEPWSCTFITCAAVNAGVALRRDPDRRAEVHEVMRERTLRVLGVAAMHEHEHLVLGAWGCGVFGNDTGRVAELFHEALSGPFRGAFARVVFAILDHSRERRHRGPFERRFG